MEKVLKTHYRHTCSRLSALFSVAYGELLLQGDHYEKAAYMGNQNYFGSKDEMMHAY